jgi:hypothetical protein
MAKKKNNTPSFVFQPKSKKTRAQKTNSFIFISVFLFQAIELKYAGFNL